MSTNALTSTAAAPFGSGWKKIDPKRGTSRIVGGYPTGEFFSPEHLAAVAADEDESRLRAEIGWRIRQTAFRLGLCLFTAAACHAFGLALFCLFLAAWDAKDVCDLIDAPA